jgi:ligand-binding sensor domain-containing protein
VRRFEGQKPEELFPTRDGTVWVALEANGIVAAHPAQAPEQWKHHLPGVKLTAFCEDKQGRIWCGSWDHGIFLLDKGQWTRMLTDEDAVLTAVRQDSKGHIWVATNAHGVWEYDGSQWVNHLADEGTINMLETTADGRVLVSSQSVCSLRQWNGKSWEILLDAPTMFIGAASDSKGKVWAGNILDGLYVQP